MAKGARVAVEKGLGDGVLRIIVCTKRDLAGCLVLNQVLERLSGHQIMVLLSDKTRPVENSVPELAEMKFFERNLPVETVFPLVDTIGGEGAKLATFAGCAARYNVPIRIVDDINGADCETLVRDFAPDLILSARFSLIFKSNIFNIPKFGTYNVHPGALPRYAGLFAPFRCIVEGDERIGCTLHRVDDGIDTGPIAEIGWLPVRQDRSLLWHVVNTYGPGLEKFYALLDELIAARPVRLNIQDRSQRVYGSLPDAEAFRLFHARGFRLFDPDEYVDLLSDFLPPGLVLPKAVGAGLGQGVRAPCCFARA